jgi:Heavy metal associated domain 2
MLAGLILEVAAEHLLPAVLSEIGEFAVRRASRAALAPHPATRRARRPRAHHGQLRSSSAAGTRPVDGDVLSHVPGRLRVRVPDLRGEAARASQLEQRLASVPGVARTQANPVTGSVLVEYDPHLTPADRIYASLTGRHWPCLPS